MCNLLGPLLRGSIRDGHRSGTLSRPSAAVDCFCLQHLAQTIRCSLQLSTRIGWPDTTLQVRGVQNRPFLIWKSNAFRMFGRFLRISERPGHSIRLGRVDGRDNDLWSSDDSAVLILRMISDEFAVDDVQPLRVGPIKVLFCCSNNLASVARDAWNPIIDFRSRIEINSKMIWTSIPNQTAFFGKPILKLSIRKHRPYSKSALNEVLKSSTRRLRSSSGWLYQVTVLIEGRQ